VKVRRLENADGYPKPLIILRSHLLLTCCFMVIVDVDIYLLWIGTCFF